MMLEGKPVAREILTTVRDDIAQIVTHVGMIPGLTVLKVGEDPSATAYARAIKRTAGSVNIPFELLELPASTNIDELQATIDRLNGNPAVAGVVVLQPLPHHLPKNLPAERVAPDKDVDGMTLLNIGRLEAGMTALVPSTPAGGVEILKHYQQQVSGKHVVIVGRSLVVGKPLAMMLLSLDATVTICHSRTPDLGSFTKEADIVAVAVGRPGILTGEMVRPGTVVLDFGVNVVDGNLVGDADSSVIETAGSMTPVPGGTGVVTNAVLMRNTVAAIRGAVGA